MNFPDTLRYTKEHEWIRVSDDGQTATVGITDFAQSELGDIVFVELEPVDSEIGRGEPFGSVEAVKAVSELFMPLSGIITAHNEALVGNPELVNGDPYDQGWMIEITVGDPGELDDLLSANDYTQMLD